MAWKARMVGGSDGMSEERLDYYQDIAVQTTALTAHLCIFIVVTAIAKQTLTLVASSDTLKLKVTSRVVGCGIPSFVGGEDAFDDYLTASGSTEEFNAWKKRKRDEEMGTCVAEAVRAALAARTNL